MKANKSPFARRLTRRILTVMSVTMIIVSGLILRTSVSGMQALSQMHFFDIMKITDDRVELILNDIEVSATAMLDDIREAPRDRRALRSTLERELRTNPYIVGSFAAFEPGYFPGEGKWYEPYARKMEDGSVEMRQIGSAGHDYLQRDWYLEGIKSEKGVWSEPYYDETGAREVLTSFVIPIRDENGRAVGVFGVDLSLKWLTSRLEEFARRENESILFTDAPGERLYSFILDKEGDYLVHPDTTRILRANFFDFKGEDADSSYVRLGRNMVSGQTDNQMAVIDGVKSYVYYAPLQGGNWSMGVVVPVASMLAHSLLFALFILLLQLLGLLLAFLLLRSAIRKSAAPLKYLAHSAEEVAKGRFDTPLPEMKHDDEIRQLRDSFENMQHALTLHIDQLKEVTTREASIERELDIARKIQMSMLPKPFLPGAGSENLELYGQLTSAKAVGGDLYDYFIRDNQLFFYIGDVSGKGVPAAMVMAVTSAQFQTLSAGETRPDRILANLNDALVSRNESLMFVTMFCGVLHLSTGELNYCNAGHDAPVLIGPDGAVQCLAVESNLALGLMPDWDYVPQKTVLSPGSALFLYTDGLTEAENADHALFGMDRVLQQAEAIGCTAPEVFVGKMTGAVREYVAGAEQSDDLTMLAIRVRKF